MAGALQMLDTGADFLLGPTDDRFWLPPKSGMVQTRVTLWLVKPEAVRA